MAAVWFPAIRHSMDRGKGGWRVNPLMPWEWLSPWDGPVHFWTAPLESMAWSRTTYGHDQKHIILPPESRHFIFSSALCIDSRTQCRDLKQSKSLTENIINVNVRVFVWGQSTCIFDAVFETKTFFNEAAVWTSVTFIALKQILKTSLIFKERNAV